MVVRSRAILAERRRGCSPPKDGAVSARLRYGIRRRSRANLALSADRPGGDLCTPPTGSAPRSLDSGFRRRRGVGSPYWEHGLAAQPGASLRGEPPTLLGGRWGSPQDSRESARALAVVLDGTQRSRRRNGRSPRRSVRGRCPNRPVPNGQRKGARKLVPGARLDRLETRVARLPSRYLDVKEDAQNRLTTAVL